MNIVTGVMTFIKDGYSDHISDGLAIVIALVVVVVLMKNWGQLIVLTIGSVILQEIILWLKPVLMDHQSLKMPPVTTGDFWVKAGYLAAAYLIMIIIFFFLKNNVFKIGRSSSH